MMDISEINKYSHKKKKIVIHNDNNITDNNDERYKKVTIKIHIEKRQNEIIRFSTTENVESNNDWIMHQSYGNDYFLRIDNKPSSNTVIYAHFFPAELYNYTESTDIASKYNFADLFEENPTDQWTKKRYPIQIKSYGYDMVKGDFNKPLIRSLLNNSIDRYKNPNYKNYIHSNDNDIDMTEKGRFPLSSRYRPSKYSTAPQFNQSTLPHWEKAEIDVSDCKRQTETPYWEVKIHRSGLSPLITNEVTGSGLDTDDPRCKNMTKEECEDMQDMPINVYLNYQYLPTSTEYHQHYYGFEGSNIKTKDGSTPIDFAHSTPEAFSDKIKNGTYEQQTSNQTYTVLDGEKLEEVSNQFKKSTTYRLINYGNPFDESYTVDLKHKNIYNINLNELPLQKKNCEFDRNNCSLKTKDAEHYWTYKAHGTDTSVYYTLSVKADAYYVFKYFIYIPADAYVEKDSCYVTIKNASNNQVIGELEKVFKDQDKNLRHQWIYHEIPFYTTNDKIQIVIKGPQHDVDGGNIDLSYEEGHECKRDVIHFASMQVAEMVEYSPTIKYTRTGMYLTEGNKYTKKPLENYTLQSSAVMTEEEIWSKASTFNYTVYHNNDIVSPVTAEKYVNAQESTGASINLDSYEMSFWLYYQFNYKAKIPCQIVGNAAHHVVMIDRGEGMVGTREEYRQLNPGYRWNDNQSTTILLPALDNMSKCAHTLPTASKWVSDTKELPIPLGDVFILFDGDFDILYNPNTYEIRWTDNEQFVFHFDEFNEIIDTELKWTTDDSVIKLKYDEIYDNTTNANWASIADTIQNWINTTKSNRNDNPNDPLLGELGLFRDSRHQKLFTTGINNEFSLLLSDAYGTPIDEGKVECAIYKNKDEYIKDLGETTPDIYGIVTYKRLNFKSLKPSQNDYYLRIRYINSCYDKDIIQWKKMTFVEEHRNMKVFVNTTNSYCQSEKNGCALQAYSAYEDDEYKLKISKQYVINSVEDLPLRLDTYITNQLGAVMDDGYCELSINDKVIQSTILDNKGIANFYIDSNDISRNPSTIQVIKIEHFTKYNETINFLYFILKTGSNYDGRPNIPININILKNDTITPLIGDTYNISKNDEKALFNIDTEDNKNFLITVQKNNETPQIFNIGNEKEDLLIMGGVNDKYIITTESSIDTSYRKTTRTINIKLE